MVEPLKIEARLENQGNRPVLIIPEDEYSEEEVNPGTYYRQVRINGTGSKGVYLEIFDNVDNMMNIIIERKDFIDGLKMIFPELNESN